MASSTPTNDFKFSLASCSIGLEKHTLHQKIEAISKAGFRGIELSMPDLQSYATLHLGRDIAEDDYESLCQAGREAGRLVSAHDLEIMVLQPFSNFEGWPEGSDKRKQAFEKAKGWIAIMEAVGTTMLQVGSSDSEGITGDKEQLAKDLAELADMLAEKGFRLAYENWCWATHAPKWRDVWEVIKLTGPRDNIGLCLDTFQSAGGEWADPTTGSGVLEEEGVSAEKLQESYTESLRELALTVPAEKIYFLQVSDAYKVDPPLDKEPDSESGLRARGRWSHDYRPLPYDGGYMAKQIEEFTGAVLSTGWKGWISVEVFDGKFKEKYGEDLNGFAQKAMESCKRLLNEGGKNNYQ